MTDKLTRESFKFVEINQTNYTGKDLFQLAEASYEHASPWSTDTFNKDLKQPFVHYFLVEQQEELVGFIGYRLIFEEAEITNIVVAKEAKGQGIGSLLLAEWFTKLKAEAAEVVHLEVRKSNQAAIRLYKKVGFQMVNIRQEYYDYPVEDAIVMKVTL